MREVSLEVVRREIGSAKNYKLVTIDDALKKIAQKMNDRIDASKRKIFQYNKETKKGYLFVKYGNIEVFGMEEDASSEDEAKEKFRVFLNDLASGKITDVQKKKVEDAMEVLKKRLEKNRAARAKK